MLTMIVMVHRYRGSLPWGRVALYKEICEVFLGKHREAHGIRQELRAEQRQQVLQPLAYHMMLQGKRDIPRDEVQLVIEHPLRMVSRDISPQQFLQDIENTSGLLLERENGVYSFSHLAFQEYLTAVYIRESRLEDTLLSQVESDWWHGTILLYCAQADATPIIEACLSKNPPSTRMLALALECMHEAREVSVNTKHRLDTIIEQGVDAVDLERRRVVAEALLTRRLQQMFPVNETTYVDTSLVTCAEYQVFLDEQRAQGHYYQPDHWKAPMFQTGQGREPVLGVRASDAQAFCDWLTQREQGGWSYRLPRLGELAGRNENLWGNLAEDTGYWVDGQPNFTWSKNAPPFSLQELFFHSFDVALAKDDLLSSLQKADHQSFDFSLLSNSDLALVDVLTLTHDRNLAHTRTFNFALDLELASTHVRNLVLDFDRNLVHVHDSAISQNYEHVRTLATSLDPDLARASTRNPDFDPNLVRVRARDRAFDLIRTISIMFTQRNAQEKPVKLESEHVLTIALNLYLTLYLLQERAEERFPAYEGILIVKERDTLSRGLE